ncbi:MAG: helix-turn-helix transcriptional regulator [Spirochaetales bacterium]|nr:helix-turn-helix transcriptional regulator [Spirochaetales bacterium]
MSESAFYILLALKEPRHGYGIILHVEEITDGRIRLGPGTIYGTLSRFEKDGLIQPIEETDRRKTYLITLRGRELLKAELQRLEELYKNGTSDGGIMP